LIAPFFHNFTLPSHKIIQKMMGLHELISSDGVNEDTHFTSAVWYERLRVKNVCDPDGWRSEPNGTHFWFNDPITWVDFYGRLFASSRVVSGAMGPIYPYGQAPPPNVPDAKKEDDITVDVDVSHVWPAYLILQQRQLTATQVYQAAVEVATKAYINDHVTLSHHLCTAATIKQETDRRAMDEYMKACMDPVKGKG